MRYHVWGYTDEAPDRSQVIWKCDDLDTATLWAADHPMAECVVDAESGDVVWYWKGEPFAEVADLDY